MQTPEEFLEANGLETRTIDRAGLVAVFQKEMEAGLAGEPSSLKMIPTFTSPYGEVTKDSPVTVLDAGGTNFRAGTVTIPSDGSEIKIEHVEKGEMPGAKSYVSQEDFYAVLTGHVQRCAPFVKDNAVGFCFSYPAEASAEGDAKLLHWTKQIQAPEIVGQWVGAEMAKRLDPKPSKITVVNDTVATLLAGKAVEKDVHYSAYLGFILGTGTNVAYIEKNWPTSRRTRTSASSRTPRPASWPSTRSPAASTRSRSRSSTRRWTRRAPTAARSASRR